MRLATISDLRTLNDRQDAHCVSILMPTTGVGAEYDKNRIRFKTLLRQTEKRLEELGLSGEERGDILGPARSLEGERPFWKACTRGLAVYASTGMFRTYRLPFETEERAAVGSRFITRPLVRLVAREDRYILLALGLGDNRLFEATPHSIREIPAENLPRGISDTLRYDVFEKHLQGHATARATGSGARMTFHGHGSSKQDRRSQVRRYVNSVADEISELLAGETAPLVVATLPHLLPDFRDACSYPNLSDGSVEVDPGHMQIEELHQRSLDPARAVLDRELDRALERYGDSAAAGEATSDADEVVLAAFDGRVDTLLLDDGARVYGRHQLDRHEVEVHDEPEDGDTDLVDLAAMKTLLQGGRVLPLPRERMPNRAPMAAILRY